MIAGRRVALVAATIGLLAAASVPCSAQQSEDELAKASQNPIADLTSFPLQWNYNSGGGLGSRTALLLNVQPVLPLALNKEWLLVSRTVVPYVSVPLPTGTRRTGVGDIQEQVYFTQRKGGKFIWGAGPIFSIPSATNDAVRTGQYALGPTAVALYTKDRWVVGALANNLWRIGGDDFGKSINQFLLQPFINFNIPQGWAITTAPIITADWSARDDEKWTVPLGGGVSKVATIGKQPVSVAMQYYHNIEHPDAAGSDQFRFTFTFLFPIEKKPERPQREEP